jgi:hypothetical protein
MRISHAGGLVVSALITAAIVAAAAQAAEPKNPLPREVFKALTEGTDFGVLSLDPEGVFAVPVGGWKVLAQNFVQDAAVRKEVVEAVKKSVEEGKGSASCFNPRHAVSASYEKKKYVLIICFECSEMLVYVGGEEKYRMPVSDSAKTVLDKILSGPGTTIND